MTEHVAEHLGLYALGGLEPEELARVEAHLVECAACRQEADAMRALATAVAQSASPVEPPRAARARVLKRVRAARPSPGAERRPLWAPLALGFSALAIVGLLSWNVYLQARLNDLGAQITTQENVIAGLRQDAAQQEQLVESLSYQVDQQEQVVRVVTAPRTITVRLVSEADPEAGARAFVAEGAQDIVLIVDHLPILGTNQTYQAWVMTPGGQPVSAGLFRVNEHGWGVYSLELSPSVDFNAIGVSLEPAGGSQAPTEVVLVGGL
jgi:anti-sigma-K factor RskA